MANRSDVRIKLQGMVVVLAAHKLLEAPNRGQPPMPGCDLHHDPTCQA